MSVRPATARVAPAASAGTQMAVTSRSDWRSFLVSTEAIPRDVLATVQAATGRDASRRGALPLEAMGYDRERDALEIVLSAGGDGSRVRCFVAQPRWLRVLPPAPGESVSSLLVADDSGECTLVRLYPVVAAAPGS
jgi:hypothetical protein